MIPPRYQGEDKGRALLLAAFGLLSIVLAQESTPGWDWMYLGLGWPREAYYAVVSASGALAGFFYVKKHRIAAFLGGLIAGAGGFFLVTTMFGKVSSTYTSMMVLVWMVGCWPGIAVYRVLARISQSLSSLAGFPDEGGLCGDNLRGPTTGPRPDRSPDSAPATRPGKILRYDSR
jgi:hypothetical protein